MASNWPRPKPKTADMYWQEYMERPKKNYPPSPKTGLVDTALQEQKLFDLDAAGYPNDNSSSSPSTTEKEPSVVSKRKTILLNERAKPSISTTEKSRNPSQYMEVPQIPEEEYQRRIATLKKLMEEYRVNPQFIFSTTATL